MSIRPSVHPSCKPSVAVQNAVSQVHTASYHTNASVTNVHRIRNALMKDAYPKRLSMLIQSSLVE